MILLLDTHLLLWATEDPARVPQAAATMIGDPANEVAFSAASIWEVAVKSAAQRADFQVNPYLLRAALLQNGYLEIPITGAHAAAVSALPHLHGDPFDRILIAQAIEEDCTLLTKDRRIAAYAGPILYF